MKLWKKIYLVTLILFLVLINCGIYLVFNMTYNKDIAVEQARAKSTFQMIEKSIEINMSNLYKDDSLEKEKLQSIIETYEKYYRLQNISLKLWKENESIYPEGEKRQKELFEDKKTIVTISKRRENKILYITKVIDIFDEDYYLYFEQPLTELQSTWNELQKRYILMSIACSILLAAVLMLLLRRLMKPINELSKAVDEMKKGQYHQKNHVKIRGKDDVSKLGENFNEMSDTISDNFLLMKEEAEKKQEFIDNFAHELKSPLTSIYGFAEYVRKAKVSEEEKEECMGFIMEESDRMLQLSYTLLDMAKLRGQSPEMKWINTNKLCRQMEYQLQKKIKEKEIAFSYEIKANEIWGNELLIESLLGNIVLNAINACEINGQIRIVIEVKNNGYEIVVTDNGCGMSREQIEHITEPFYRIDKARSRKNGGTGLGLALCKQIAEAHKGEILFISTPKEGTKAVIKLERKQGE